MISIHKTLQDKFDQHLECANLITYKEKLYTYLKPCIKITISDKKDTILGVSKIGGIPDLPSNLKWPTKNNIPLRFVMQINLSELPENSHLFLSLPTQGHLYFFIGDDDQCYDIPNVIIYSQETPTKQNKIDTSEFYEQWDFPENQINLFEWISLPYSEELDESNIFTKDELEEILHWDNEKHTSKYDNLTTLLEENWKNASQLGGWPLEQFDVIKKIQMQSLFSYYGKDKYEIEFLKPPLYPENDVKTAERMNLKLLAEDYKEQYEGKLQNHLNLKNWFKNVEHLLPKWNLLLALNSHQESNMCWWDTAIMNFMVKNDDLKNMQEIKGYTFFESS